MRLKGLPYYDVIDEDGQIKVYSHRRRRFVHLSTKGKDYKVFYLFVNGKTKRFSEGFLRFLMRHPEIDATLICPQKQNICFASDGTVRGNGAYTRGRNYRVFRDIDDALDTVLIMKATLDNDLTYVLSFMEENRERAISVVAKLVGSSITRIRDCVEDAEELFISQLRTARCERIAPLFSWYCRCIKSTFMTSWRKASLERSGLENTRLPGTDDNE